MSTSAIGPIVELSPSDVTALIESLRGGRSVRVAINVEGFRVRSATSGIWSPPMGIIRVSTFSYQDLTGWAS